jgi:uncharacterized phage-associated protein
MEKINNTIEEYVRSKKGEEYSREISDGKRKREVILPQILKCVEVLKYIVKELADLGIKPDIYKVLKMLYLADRVHLIKYNELIAHDIYLKMGSPVPQLCLMIIQAVCGYKFPVTLSVEEEIKVVEDPETGERNILHNLADPDLDYLSESNKECLKRAIAKYGHLDFSKLREESHDDIYKSVDDHNDEITIFDMLEVLENNKEFAEHCLEILDK